MTESEIARAVGRARDRLEASPPDKGCPCNDCSNDRSNDRVLLHLSDENAEYAAAIEGWRKAEDEWRGIRAELESRAASLVSENRRLREALEFYRDGWTFKTNRHFGGLEWTPKEVLLDDCGNKARAVLQDTAQREG